ncbi:2-hydroxyhepta-2,4-diene-1,7-dioate isomerase [Marinobacterium zhoushanense]|uniref:2-hydroxyhepta-2,4-diene-1,7-dioate isomerase n=1 Tax=Marinobacterium zhoushanense TaxID=1679163 RepID=A0ABQ1K1S0_9GAMM|nr:fumarylacetoacetate hydrolase family protein [Marinobacterium zhoushanense]GGB81384.1 2-hydroxyhepta-2,4-diene-1,7-dioate isomerase [Marinobacterium zhoushanense]
MKLARYTYNNRTSVGLVADGRIYDIPAALPHVPANIREIFAAGRGMLDEIARELPGARKGLALDEVRLEAPINDPQKYMAIGMNYHDHAEEARAAGIPIPTTQLWFNKQVSCITGPYHPVVKPKVSDRLDYEAEMGVVIGKRCRYVSEADARSVVAGYFVSNDMTARDWQAASPTFTLGKSFDTHGPIGPWIVTDDEIEDPHDLEMRLSVNGEPRQKSSTGGMIYNIWQQISHLSQVMTLEPGDLIATGTCANVGIALDKFLQPGDVVRVEIDKLGHIENTIVDE